MIAILSSPRSCTGTDGVSFFSVIGFIPLCLYRIIAWSAAVVACSKHEYNSYPPTIVLTNKLHNYLFLTKWTKKKNFSHGFYHKEEHYVSFIVKIISTLWPQLDCKYIYTSAHCLQLLERFLLEVWDSFKTVPLLKPTRKYKVGSEHVPHLLCRVNTILIIIFYNTIVEDKIH